MFLIASVYSFVKVYRPATARGQSDVKTAWFSRSNRLHIISKLLALRRMQPTNIGLNFYRPDLPLLMAREK